MQNLFSILCTSANWSNLSQQHNRTRRRVPTTIKSKHEAFAAIVCTVQTGQKAGTLKLQLLTCTQQYIYIASKCPMRIMEIGWKADIFAGPSHQSQTLRAAAQDIQSTGSRRQFPGVPGIHTNKLPLLSVTFSRDEKAQVFF